MPEPPGPISMTSYTSGWNATQPKEDGSDWDNSWPSIDMHRVHAAVNYFNMHTFSVVIVGLLYHGRSVVSKFGRITNRASLDAAMYGPGASIARIREYQVEEKLWFGTTEDTCYTWLLMNEVPVKVVGVVLQKID